MQLEHLLNLKRGNNRSAGNRGRYARGGRLSPPQTCARIAHRHPFAILFCKITLITRSFAWQEDLNGAIQAIEAAIDPWLACAAAGAVDGPARFAIIDAANYDIHPPKYSQTYVTRDVRHKGLCAHIRIQFPHAVRGDMGLGKALIGSAK